METALLVVGVLSLALWAIVAIDIATAVKFVRYVDQVPLPSREAVAAFPRVSVVVPARNEERHLAGAMRSILALDYPDLEIIAIDDRSDDRTGEILDELAAADPRLRVLHLTELPDGWLGKNHALQCAAEEATGELILFTDADVFFEPTVLARAVACVREGGLDHLTIVADVHTPSLLVEMFVVAFAVTFVGYFRPWRMGDPNSSATVGIGAFNLVRKQTYFDAGGHRPIAMRPDDDLKLASLLRDHGARQAFGVAGGMVAVEWYASLREAFHGLEKNSLAVVDFKPWMLLGGAPAQLLTMCWPFVALFVTSGPLRWLNAAIVALLLAGQMLLLQGGSLRWWIAFLLPVAVPLLIFAYLRAVFLTYVRGGIRWRGTFYSLKELRQEGNRQ
ncbi:MAG: glycosyltransferase [Acidobacteria bacterium]|nr:glycosyltransferase [Acidobacteriota bacterium]